MQAGVYHLLKMPLEMSNNIEIFGGASAKESCEMYYDAIQAALR